ncbi:MAG: DNA cytosine methyltransferase [Promethearchaeota archaeon]
MDLFAGCGGFSQGFLAAGYNIFAANEFWEPAIETYKFNHGTTHLIEGDITLLEIKQELYSHIKNKKIHVIIGGPPCQAYSISGNRNPDDPRGRLYMDFLEIVDHLQPDFFVMENVKGLLHMKHVDPNISHEDLKTFKMHCHKLQRYKDLKRYRAQRALNPKEEQEYSSLMKKAKELKQEIDKRLIPLLDIILSKMKEINYEVEWKVLNAANYGVPQTRERIIFMGTRHDKTLIQFPGQTHYDASSPLSIDESNISSLHTNSPKNYKSWKTVGEILKKYETWEENVELSHVFTKHSKKFIQKLHETPIGENVYKNYSDAWRRLDPNRPAKTVKENHGGVFVHYKFDRTCTPRELAALQSFDDTFIFKGTKSAILKQIGNAVPPLLAKAIAEQIKKKLDILYSKR